MRDKIQMTEEQAREIWHDCIFETRETPIDAFINGLKQCGYIRKSELEMLVEEAELKYQDKIKERECFEHISKYGITDIVDTLYYALQALKKSHPEFKK